MARNNPKLDKIYEVFDKHKVDIDRDSIWSVKGTPVVKHKDVERLGAKLGIVYDSPKILRAERDEAVILVTGSMGERSEWSIGEALIVREGEVGGNYKVTGNQASYVYAMAEKRAKDRVILKLADLHGDAYSEDEADDFKDSSKRDRDDRSANNDNSSKSEVPSSDLLQRMKSDLDDEQSIEGVTNYMNHAETIRELSKVLSKDEAAEVKNYAT